MLCGASHCLHRQWADERFTYLIRRALQAGRYRRAQALDIRRSYAVPLWGQSPLPSLFTAADWAGLRAEWARWRVEQGA